MRPGSLEGRAGCGQLNLNYSPLELIVMNTAKLSKANTELRNKTPLEITKWAIAQTNGFAIVSTNFRPYEAVVLHLAVQAFPNIPVLWVDHGYNRPATYKHAEQLIKLLKLNIKSYTPRITVAHREAIYGPVPGVGDEKGLKEFSAQMKLEPFQRGMKDLAPRIWITGLRRSQNPNRAELDIVTEDTNFGAIKVNPVFYLSDDEMDLYLRDHKLPNEWDYYDPAKADEKRECGLHANWGKDAVAGTAAKKS